MGNRALIVALAGRQVDPENVRIPRFPTKNVAEVQERIRALLVERGADALVCSAAAGADLLALRVAGELGLRRRIILPFARDRFRETSVIDRPGNWALLYERVLAEVEAVGDLVVLPDVDKGDAAYAVANMAILDDALGLVPQVVRNCSERGVLVAIVWEGGPRGTGDLTAAFAADAHARGLPVVEVLTIGRTSR